MNPRTALDQDAVIEQLSRLDSSDPGDAAIDQPSSTVRELKAELDTLLSQLRQPVEPEPFADETGLRRAQELVLAIGLEPETKGNTDQSEPGRPELGRIGPYELLEKLGQGGMGAVYKALHTSLEKIVALKVLPRDRLTPAAIARFKREMKAVGKLDHPNIVRATDAGEADGDHFLVMEYVEGVDLAELLRRVGPLPPAEACELMRQAAVGLQHAHQRGMVHRDIKPNNIMLAWSDGHTPAVKILDMGLALLNEPKSPAHGDLTTSGQMMGTLEYMSPEQGLDTHNVDIRADIYSLGATLYKLLGGKAPFSGERYNTPGKLMVALATETPPSVGTLRADLPAGLVALVDRLLARAPAERPATPAEVAQALAPFASGADLRRLADAARQQAPISNKTADQSITPTELHLSSPTTGTKPDVCRADVAESGDRRGAPEPVAVRKRVIPIQRVALAVSGVLLILFAVVIYRVQTDKGTLVVEIDEQDAEVIEAKLKAGGLEVKDTSSGRIFKIQGQQEQPERSGNYKLADGQGLAIVVEDADGLKVATNEFKLTRGERTRIRVTLTPNSVAAKSPTIDSKADPDRRAAEWVLKSGGEVVLLMSDGSLTSQLRKIADLPAVPFRLYLANVGDCQFGDDELRLFEDLGEFRVFRMPVGATITDAGLPTLGKLNKLAILEINLSKTTVEGRASLGAFPELSELAVQRGVTNETIQQLRTICPNLSFLALDIGEGKLSEAGFQELSKWETLSSLNLSNISAGDLRLMPSGYLGSLKAMKKLRSLLLSHIALDDGGLQQIGELADLDKLAVTCSRLPDAGLAHLRNLKSLAHLDLYGSTIPDVALKEIGALTTLQVLFLGVEAVSDVGLDQLHGLKNLRVLNLQGSKVSEAGITRLAAALPNCHITWDGGVIEPKAEQAK